MLESAMVDPSLLANQNLEEKTSLRKSQSNGNMNKLPTQLLASRQPQTNFYSQNYNVSSSMLPDKSKNHIFPFIVQNASRSTLMAMDTTADILEQSKRQFDLIVEKSAINNTGDCPDIVTKNEIRHSQASIMASNIDTNSIDTVVAPNSPLTCPCHSKDDSSSKSPSTQLASLHEATNAQSHKILNPIEKPTVKSPKSNSTAIGQSSNYSYPHNNANIISDGSNSSEDSDHGISFTTTSLIIPEIQKISAHANPKPSDSSHNERYHTHPPSSAFRQLQSHEERRSLPQRTHRKVKSSVRIKPPTIRDSSIYTSHSESNHPYYRNTTVIIGGFNDMDATPKTTPKFQKNKSVMEPITPDDSNPCSPISATNPGTGNPETGELLSNMGIVVFPKPPVTSLLSMTSRSYVSLCAENENAVRRKSEVDENIVVPDEPVDQTVDIGDVIGQDKEKKRKSGGIMMWIRKLWMCGDVEEANERQCLLEDEDSGYGTERLGVNRSETTGFLETFKKCYSG